MPLGPPLGAGIVFELIIYIYICIYIYIYIYRERERERERERVDYSTVETRASNEKADDRDCHRIIILLIILLWRHVKAMRRQTIETVTGKDRDCHRKAAAK
jgi:hypothetical protein